MELFIEKFENGETSSDGVPLEGDYGVFDNSGRCYEIGSWAQCERYIEQRLPEE